MSQVDRILETIDHGEGRPNPPPSPVDWQAELGVAAQIATRIPTTDGVEADMAALADALLRVVNWAQTSQWYQDHPA